MFDIKEYEQAYIDACRLLGMQTRKSEGFNAFQFFDLWLGPMPSGIVGEYWTTGYPSEFNCALEYARMHGHAKLIQEGLDAIFDIPEDIKDHLGNFL